MYEVISAVYEKGVLKPLQEIPLRNHQRVKIILETNIGWRRDFKNLLKRIYSRTNKFKSTEIENDITFASRQIRKNACKSST